MLPDNPKTAVKPFFILSFCFLVISVSAQEFRNDTVRVFFPNDRMELSQQALNSLDSLLPMILRNKKAPLRIEGYADYTGTPGRNEYLSSGRALSVKQYLVNKGIDSLRLANSKGMGTIEPKQKPQNLTGIPQHRKAELIVQWPVAKKNVAKKPVSKKPETTLNLEKMKVGEKIVLPNVNFEPGRHFLLSQSYPVLSEVSKILKEHPNIKIEIQGHICCDSVSADGYDSDTKTNELSLNRAKYVYSQLNKMGIDSTRMTYKGFGGKVRLKKAELTTMDQMRNRRVEIKIISN